MPRANRYFLPGHLWHITHRCHGKEFLLDGEFERQEWLSWLRKARDRYQFTVLGYAATCNHIHLMVQDTGRPEAIARGMQLIQGRVAQICNKRTGRINAFWGDRYHATAIESGVHLLRCIAYIDINMVRAGVVKHPRDWRDSGYHEIHDARVREGIIDKRQLAFLLGCPEVDSMRRIHLQIIEETLRQDVIARDGRWTESVAIGSQVFIQSFAAALGKRKRGRNIEVVAGEGVLAVREADEAQSYDLGYEQPSVALEGDNTREFIG